MQQRYSTVEERAQAVVAEVECVLDEARESGEQMVQKIDEVGDTIMKYATDQTSRRDLYEKAMRRLRDRLGIKTPGRKPRSTH